MPDFDSNLPNSYEEEKIDYRRYVHSVARNWWWFAITLLLSLVVAYMVNRYSQKQYQVSCSIILNSGNIGGNGVESLVQDLTNSGSQQSAPVIENEISILKSKLLARMTLQQLDFGVTYVKVGRRGIAETELYKSVPFIFVPDSLLPCIPNTQIHITFLTPTSYTLTIEKPWNIKQDLKVGETFRNPDFNFQVLISTPEDLDQAGPFPQSYYVILNTLQSLSKAYSEALTVKLNNEQGSVLNLSLSGRNGDKLCDYLNKICEVYALYSLSLKNSASANAIHFINSQLDYITQSLHDAGNRLQHFRTTEKVLDIVEESNSLYTLTSELNAEKEKLTVNKTYYSYLKKYFEDKQHHTDIIAPAVVGIDDRLLEELVASINRLITKKRDLNVGNTKKNPVISNIDIQLESLRNDVIENLSNLIIVNDIALKSTTVRADSAEMEVRRLPYTESKLANIQREYGISDNIYTFLLQKKAETSIAMASNSADNRVLDKAQPEDIISLIPRNYLNYMIAICAGLMLPLAIIIIKESFSNKIKSLQDIESLTSIAIAGKIGHNSSNESIPVMSHPRSQLAESFRSLRSNLKYFGLRNNNRVISVTSTISGEGKTFCAVNLAAILAIAGHRTLLVDLDLRRPRIHRIFTQNNETGLSTFLAGQCAFQEVFVPTTYVNLFVARSGPIPPNPVEMIDSYRMTTFFELVKTSFDIIVIDTPPIAFVTDAMQLTGFIDLQLVVVRHDYTSKELFQLINELNRSKRIQNIALVINDIKDGGLNIYGKHNGYNYGYVDNKYFHSIKKNTFFGGKLIEDLKRRFPRC